MTPERFAEIKAQVNEADKFCLVDDHESECARLYHRTGPELVAEVESLHRLLADILDECRTATVRDPASCSRRPDCVCFACRWGRMIADELRDEQAAGFIAEIDRLQRRIARLLSAHHNIGVEHSTCGAEAQAAAWGRPCPACAALEREP